MPEKVISNPESRQAHTAHTRRAEESTPAEDRIIFDGAGHYRDLLTGHFASRDAYEHEHVPDAVPAAPAPRDWSLEYQTNYDNLGVRGLAKEMALARARGDADAQANIMRALDEYLTSEEMQDESLTPQQTQEAYRDEMALFEELIKAHTELYDTAKHSALKEPVEITVRDEDAAEPEYVPVHHIQKPAVNLAAIEPEAELAPPSDAPDELDEASNEEALQAEQVRVEEAVHQEELRLRAEEEARREAEQQAQAEAERVRASKLKGWMDTGYVKLRSYGGVAYWAAAKEATAAFGAGQYILNMGTSREGLSEDAQEKIRRRNRRNFMAGASALGASVVSTFGYDLVTAGDDVNAVQGAQEGALYDQEELIQTLAIEDWARDRQDRALQIATFRIGTAVTEGLTESQTNEYQAIIDDDQSVIDAWLEQHAPEYKNTPVYQHIEAGYDADPEKNNPAKLFASLAWVQRNVPDLQTNIDTALASFKAELARV